MYRLWRDGALDQILTHSSYPRQSYCSFDIWPYDLEYVLRVALGSGIIFTKFDLWHLIHTWIKAFFDADTLCHAVTLTIDPLELELLQHLECHAFKLFQRNRMIHGWVMDDLARFRRAVLGSGGTTERPFSGARGPNFIALGEDIGRPWLHKNFALQLQFGYLAAFSNADWIGLDLLVSGLLMKLYLRSNFCTRYVTLWPWPSISWPWTFATL